MTSQAIASELGKTGLCICPNFLNTESLREIRGDLDSIRASNRFHRAGVGHQDARQVRSDVRGDSIHWLEHNDSNDVQARLWEKLASLKQAFNRSLYLGLTDFEGHYACYPKDSFYNRHLDSFTADNSRMVSLVIYLNKDWKLEDGGALRIYDGDLHTDVDPVGGTMVCFFSRESEHEVLLSTTPRFSFTGWFKT